MTESDAEHESAVENEDELLAARLEEAKAQTEFNRLSTTTPLTLAVLAIVVSVYVGLYTVAASLESQASAMELQLSNLMVDRTLAAADEVEEAAQECTRAQLALNEPIDLESAPPKEVLSLPPQELRRVLLAEETCRRVEDQREILNAVSGGPGGSDVSMPSFSSQPALLGLVVVSVVLLGSYLRTRSRLDASAEALERSRTRRMRLERAEEIERPEPPAPAPPTPSWWRRWRT